MKFCPKTLILIFPAKIIRRKPLGFWKMQLFHSTKFYCEKKKRFSRSFNQSLCRPKDQSCWNFFCQKLKATMSKRSKIKLLIEENPNTNPQSISSSNVRKHAENRAIFLQFGCWPLLAHRHNLSSALINWKHQIRTNDSISCSRRHKKTQKKLHVPDKT